LYKFLIENFHALNFDYKNINSKINNLMRKTRDEIKLRGSIVNEITTKGDFINKIRNTFMKT